MRTEDIPKVIMLFIIFSIFIYMTVILTDDTPRVRVYEVEEALENIIEMNEKPENIVVSKLNIKDLKQSRMGSDKFRVKFKLQINNKEYTEVKGIISNKGTPYFIEIEGFIFSKKNNKN